MCERVREREGREGEGEMMKEVRVGGVVMMVLLLLLPEGGR